MPLMVSISGIRGVVGDGFDAATIVKYTSGFAAWCHKNSGKSPAVIVGRDARVTGEACAHVVTGALQLCGCNVVDAGLATTPTVEMAVLAEKAAGAIILSASHNPAEWNALKLLNSKGEFLSPEEALEVISLSEEHCPSAVDWDCVGSYRRQDFLQHHIDAILALPYIDVEAIRARGFKVVVDGINSVGGIAIPALLRALGVREENIICINCEPTGRFAHNPEPLPAHLEETVEKVRATGADLGIVVDPDADRLAFVEDGGRFLSEELTQVLAADFILARNPGPIATNLSSSRAMDDIAEKHGQPIYRSSVGEINVVKEMQRVGAVFGGEGNGGVIIPELHYGRDALVGTAIVLQHLAERQATLSELRAELPAYAISKNKAPLDGTDADAVLKSVARKFADERISTIDGVKIDFDEGWVHLRKSNTEPIIRIYAEARTSEQADALARRFIDELKAAG